MAQQPRLICDSAELEEGGRGVRFEVNDHGRPQAAFVVRYDSEVRAYLNRCAHVPVELDWQLGQFFDREGLYIICATHGAVYQPDTGVCVGGPCPGKRLVQLAVFEQDGKVWLRQAA